MFSIQNEKPIGLEMLETHGNLIPVGRIIISPFTFSCYPNMILDWMRERKNRYWTVHTHTHTHAHLTKKKEEKIHLRVAPRGGYLF